MLRHRGGASPQLSRSIIEFAYSALMQRWVSPLAVSFAVLAASINAGILIGSTFLSITDVLAALFVPSQAAPTVVAMHDLTMASQFCSRIICLHSGRIQVEAAILPCSDGGLTVTPLRAVAVDEVSGADQRPVAGKSS